MGGGNTAVDAAVQARRLGADEVTLVYRRGAENMSATVVEREWAQTNGVTVRLWAAPIQIVQENGVLAGVEFAKGHSNLDGKAIYSAEDTFFIPADMLLKAVGQIFHHDPVSSEDIEIRNGRIVVDSHYRTSMRGVYAGGDCTAGEDLTVAAVRDGRDAAEAINIALQKDA